MTTTPADPPPATRRRPAVFRALGRDDPPPRITVDGCDYERVTIFKHDSWAATALYVAAGHHVDDAHPPSAPANPVADRIVCKFNRRQPIGPLPARWIGRRLARRERAMLARLHDVDQIPPALGDVFVDGERQRHAAARRFIEGRPMRRDEWISDDFVEQLRSLVAAMHRRDIAYVDLHKHENVIVGDDGRPHLVDFQVGFMLPPRFWARRGPARWLLRWLQRLDEYHWAKHVVRGQPQRLSDPHWRRLAQPPLLIRLHRLVAVPFRKFRRGLLVKLGVRAPGGRAESEREPEDVHRHDDGHGGESPIVPSPVQAPSPVES